MARKSGICAASWEKRRQHFNCQVSGRFENTRGPYLMQARGDPSIDFCVSGRGVADRERFDQKVSPVSDEDLQIIKGLAHRTLDLGSQPHFSMHFLPLDAFSPFDR
jgi:hypothetical protein